LFQANLRTSGWKHPRSYLCAGTSSYTTMTHRGNGRQYPHVVYASHSPPPTFCQPKPTQRCFIVAYKGGNDDKNYVSVSLGNPSLYIEPARGPFPERTHLILKIIQMLRKTVICQTRFHLKKLYVKPHVWRMSRSPDL